MAALTPVAVYTPATDATLASTAKDATQRTLTKTVAAGQIIVIKYAIPDSGGVTVGLPTDTQGLTWTQRAIASEGSTATPIAILWTSSPTSAGSITITTAAPTAGRWQRAVVEVWPTGTTIGAVVQVTPTLTDGLPTATLTTTGTDSAVSTLIADYQGRTATPAYTGTVTSEYVEQSSSIGSHYQFYKAAPTAGSQTVGMSSPTAQRWGLVAAEMKQAAVAPAIRFGGYLRLHARRSIGIQASAYLGPPPVTPPGNITHGQQVNAANTGLNVDNTALNTLTTTGATTYSTNGQTITGRDFTGPVSITGNNVTLRNSRITVAATGTGFENGLSITGTGVTVENCLIVAPDGTSMYHCIYIGPNATGATIRRVDASRGENLVTSYASSVVLEECYLHDTSLASRPDGHEDGVECYAGSMIARRCKVTLGAGTRDGAFNIGSYASGGPASGADVDYCHVLDSYLDGGNAHVLLDDAKTGGVGTRNVRVLRCLMGGHTNVGVHGRYKALQNNDGRSIVSTQGAQASSPLTIWWPTSGADASTWIDCTDLTPDRTGESINP